MSSILEGSYFPFIHGATFIANTHQSTRPTITGFDKLMQAASPNAFHNSDDRPDPPKCHENTRVAVINKIMHWVTGVIDMDAYILWFYGPAGAGKTAIARSVAELCEARGLLLASFFFFRSDAMRSTINPLVASIAYCVACAIPGARECIEAVIDTNPLVLSYSVEAQFAKLVFEPLRLLADREYRFPPLIVIDGLDECREQDAQTNLIRILSSSVARYQLPLKFIIVSRPEPHIKSAVGLAGKQSTISHLQLNDDYKPDEDIRQFLTDKFHDIKTCHPLSSQIPYLWPSKRQIERLVRKSSGQFIYASLAARFINSACDLPMRQLDIILGLRPPTDLNLPFAELDTLYSFILSCTKNIELVLRILGIAVAILDGSGNPYVDVIQSVLGLDDNDVHLYLSALSSLLEIKEYGVIVFYHASFMDFLCSPERSQDYCLDELATIHSFIAQRVLQTFTDNGSSLARRQGIDNRQVICNIYVPIHLKFAMWTPDLEHAVVWFSLPAYLDWLHCLPVKLKRQWLSDFPATFLNHLKNEEKPELYRHHATQYLDYVTTSFNNHPSSMKFHLLGTVWFVLQETLTLERMTFPSVRWRKLCATLIGFDSTDMHWDYKHYDLMRKGNGYERAPVGAIFGNIAETKKLVPEPILSQRLANVAISCMRYLYRQGPNIPSMWDHLLAWAMKSKRSPWLWRQRMRVTSIRKRSSFIRRRLRGVPLTEQRPFRWGPTYRYSFSQSLRQSRRMLYSEGFQSARFYRRRHIFYIWTLDLLYHTLCKAMKSAELIRALSKPFIPSSAALIHPHRVRSVKEAAEVYVDEFCSPWEMVASGRRRVGSSRQLSR